MGQHLPTLSAARPVLRDLWRSGDSIGSVHSLGALHIGHGKVIEAAAKDNKHVIVTVYPNKIQLAPGSTYRYNLERDVDFAFSCGATHVISSRDDEMFSSGFCTFIDQQPMHSRLDATQVPYIFRGMITGCLRWISFCRPTRSYWGLKDIGQYLLVRRAVKDLLIDSEVVPVPCVRFRNGVPISSRLYGLPPSQLHDLQGVYQVLQTARELIGSGETNSNKIVKSMLSSYDKLSSGSFKVGYVKVVCAETFEDLETIKIPFVIHMVVTNGTINCFDGVLVRDDTDLHSGPPVIWLDHDIECELQSG
jgi:pantoate--beta-alanine ligase